VEALPESRAPNPEPRVHPDWLGNSRFASTPTRTKYFGTAYAPYGEPYAESGTTDLSFAGQKGDTADDEYDFLYREYHYIQGRCPAGRGTGTND